MSNFGYFRLFTDGCVKPEILTEQLGSVFNTEKTFKMYPCCRSTHDSIEAALNLVHEHPVDTDQIRDITLKVPASVLNMFVSQPFKIRTAPQIDAAFNVRYCVANVLLRKEISLEHFKEDAIRNTEIERIIDKISLGELEKPFAPDMGASLTIRMNSGEIFTSDVDFAKGEPGLHPVSKAELIEKFMKNVAFSGAVTVKRAERIISLIDHIEDIEDARELTELLMFENEC
jgi:2-methylcitrate dehydratase PrpD